MITDTNEITIENALCQKCFHPIIEHHPFFGCVYGPNTSNERCGCKELDLTATIEHLITENRELKRKLAYQERVIAMARMGIPVRWIPKLIDQEDGRL